MALPFSLIEPESGLIKPGQQGHQRRLARAGIADDCDELPLLDFERDIFEHLGALALSDQSPWRRS